MASQIDELLEKCDELFKFYGNLAKFKDFFGYKAFQEMHAHLKKFSETCDPEQLKNEAYQKFVFTMFNDYIIRAFGKSHDMLAEDDD